jgi:replicative DNA helicase
MDTRVPPQNLQAEQSVLGGLMLDQDQESWDNVSDILKDDDFYKPAHRTIYMAIRELNKRGSPTDLVTVSNFLMQKNLMDSIGGPSYLGEVIEQSVSSIIIKSHAQIIRDKSTLRKIIHTGQEYVDRAFTHDFTEVDAFINDLESAVYKISELSTSQDMTDASSLVRVSIAKLEELYAQKGDVTGVGTGFIDLDKMTAGFQPSDLIIVAARPSVGKTAFSLNIAINAALREKKTVAYFSVEMAKEQVMMRVLGSEARVSLSGLRSGNIDSYAWPKLISTAAKISETQIFIDDTPSVSPYEIRAKARRMKAKYGLDMIIIDYLQMMSMKQKVESREREVAEISKMLKGLARELKVPVVALSQLNRSVEGRSDRRPMLSDLRESGSIEQDADVIMMLYRDDYYDKDNPELQGTAEVIIGKQRNGPTGTVKLRWQPEFGLFSNNIEQAQGPTPPMPTSANQHHILRPSHDNNDGPSQGNNGKPKNFAPSL